MIHQIKRLAGREIGFFAIVGHGVDEGLMARTRRTAVEIFALPTDEKLGVERPPTAGLSTGSRWSIFTT